jgi:hypothetical protein
MAHHPLGPSRDRAARYLILTIAAFAVTVAGTRWYLDLAGYPTVGGGQLHIAHALWGGLALFIGAALPLLYSGRRALTISAILAGFGVGLFIDEVGKFMTTSNNYFYAPAAPIIYGSILLLVLLWVLVRRRGHDGYDATHAVIEALGDGFDGRLTAQDRERVIDELRESQTGADDSLAGEQLSGLFAAALESPAMDERLASEGWVARGGARRLLERILPTRVERWLVVASLVLEGLAAAVAIVAMVVLWASAEGALNDVEPYAASAGRLEFPTEPIWIVLSMGIAVVVGLTATAALVLIGRGRTMKGLNLALMAVLTNLVAGGLVNFYAAQMPAITTAVLTVVQLGLIVDLRIRTERSALTPLPDES